MPRTCQAEIRPTGSVHETLNSTKSTRYSIQHRKHSKKGPDACSARQCTTNCSWALKQSQLRPSLHEPQGICRTAQRWLMTGAAASKPSAANCMHPGKPHNIEAATVLLPQVVGVHTAGSHPAAAGPCGGSQLKGPMPSQCQLVAPKH